MRHILFVLFATASLCARSQIAGGISEQYAPLKETKEIFDKYLRNTDSAEWKIKELVSIKQRTGATDADFGKMMAKLQAGLILEKYVPQPDSATFILNYLMGDIFSGTNPGTAIYFYRKCLAISQVSPQISHERKFHMFGAIAGQFAHLHKNDSVLAYYRLEASEAEKSLKPNVALASTTNNIGIFYALAGAHDSAIAYYRAALAKLGDMQNDLVLYCSITDNIAQESWLQNNLAPALKTYQFNDSVYLALQRPNRYIINKVRLLTALQKTQAPGADIERQIGTANAYIAVHAADIRPAETLKFYAFATAYFFDGQNRQSEAFFSRLYNALRDSVEKQTTEKLNIITATLLSVQGASFGSEYESQRLLVEKQKALLKTAIVSGVVIISLLILIIHRRRQRQKSERLFAAAQLKTKELEAKAALYDLEMKKKDLVNVALHNTRVYEGNLKLAGQLNEILHKGDGMEKALKSLLIDLKNQSRVDESVIVIQNNINEVNAAFYEKLKQQFPYLTPTEAELCGYVRINLSNKDISAIKNIEASSIKMAKTRLKKKLGLMPEDDLYSFVNKF